MKELSKQGELCMEGIQWMCCWESFQKSQSIFKTGPWIKRSCQNILPVSYLGMPIKLLLHMQVYEDWSWYVKSCQHTAEPFFSADGLHLVSLCAALIDWWSLSHRGHLWMKGLLDSCAGTDCDAHCQLTEPFYPRCPWALLSAYRQSLPCRASMTKQTSGFNSSLCASLAGPVRLSYY